MNKTAEQLYTQLDSWASSLENQGTSYAAALDQLVALLALKLDHAYTRPPFAKQAVAPEGHSWVKLSARSGQDLVTYWQELLNAVGQLDNTLGTLMRRAQAAISSPAVFTSLISQIDQLDDVDASSWAELLDTGALEAAFDQLLYDAAFGSESGIRFIPTPRPVAQAIAQVLNPQPGESFADPAAGSGGLLTALAAEVRRHDLDRVQRVALRDDAIRAVELQPDVSRWLTFNLLAHGLGTLDGHPLVEVANSLADPGRTGFDVVATNPQFGRAEAQAFQAATSESRQDITVTGNRQLDFLQHVERMLAINGRAAVFIPDNVLFEAGAGATIRRGLLDRADVHTLVRLPTGISSKPGVKTNVLFFDRKPAAETPWTDTLWIYDLRTNQRFTPKKNPIGDADLQDFIETYCVHNRAARSETERFRAFSYQELLGRPDVSLDIVWLRDDTHIDIDNLPDPDLLAEEIANDLAAAREEFLEIGDAIKEA